MAAEQGPDQTGIPETEKIKSITTGLFESDYNALQDLAGEMALSRSLVVRFAMQDFFQRHQTGEISLKAEEGALLIQSNTQAAVSDPAPKPSGKKKKAPALKKGKKKKKGTKPAKKKK